MPSRSNAKPLGAEFELRRMVQLKQVAEFTTLSEDTIKTVYADKVKRVSPGRLTMTVGDMLAIGTPFQSET